ncbi:MAG: molecular chaperone DnaK, partial [Methanoregula sp.]
DRLNAAITGVKSALEGKDASSIKTETEKLQKVLSEAGTAAYQAAARQQAEQQGASQGTGQPSQNTGGPGGENVVDADFKVKDEK